MSAEVAVGSLDTPIGVLWIACSERGVCKVIFPCEGGRGILEHWLASYSPVQRADRHKRVAGANM